MTLQKRVIQVTSTFQKVEQAQKINVGLLCFSTDFKDRKQGPERKVLLKVCFHDKISLNRAYL